MAEELETEAAETAAKKTGVDRAQIADLREKLAEQEGGRPHEYVKTLVALAEALEPGEEKIELLLKAADLYANKFMNQAEAVKTFERILEEDPRNAQAAEFLEQMYEKRRDWEKLIALKKVKAESIEHAASRLAALKEIAELATERVKKPDVCVDLWVAVTKTDPDDVTALNALSQLYERKRDYEELAGVLERLVGFIDDVPEKIQILTKLGQIAGDRLKDEERAVEAYRQLLALDPEDRRAQEQLKKRYVTLGRWDDLETFYTQTGKWDEFIRVLESNEARSEDLGQRAGMLMKISELWITQKGKADRAARALEKILSLDDSHLEAAERLIPLYANLENHKGLSTALEVKLKHVQDTEQRVALLRQVAELYEGRAGSPELAFERFAEIVKLSPMDPQAHEDVERLAAATSSWPALITTLSAAIDQCEENADIDASAALRLRLGRVLSEQGAVDKAVEQYRAVVELQPENVAALEALEQLYRKSERWEDLLSVYTQRIQSTPIPEEQRELLYQIARLQESELGDFDAAIEAYQSVLAEEPADAVALSELDKLYLATKNWTAYAEVLRRRLDLTDDDEKVVDLKFRLAEVEAKHLKNRPAALERLREILSVDQDHQGATAALEAFLDDKDLRGEAAQILETIHEARGDWEKLLVVSEILVETSDEDRQVELLRKIAITAATQLGDSRAAFKAQARALRIAPHLLDAREELESFAGQAEAWDALTKVYSKIAKSAGGDLARDYSLRMAAIEERLYASAENWEELIKVYLRRIDLSDDENESRTLYTQLAQLYQQRLNQPEEAIAAYRKVLEIEPGNAVALSALDSLLASLGRWAELSENLETRLSLAESEQEQVSIMLRLARLRQEKMADVNAAIDGYRQVLEKEPSNAEALEALERLGQSPAYALLVAEIVEPLYRQQGDYQKLIAVHETQVERSEDAARRVELLHQVAELYEDAAGDIQSAFRTYGRALREDPSNETTREGLERLVASTSKFEELATLYEQLGAVQDEPELSSQLLTAAARVAETALGDGNRAIGLYQRVLEVDQSNLAAVEALQALFRAGARHADTSALLQRKALMLEDVDEQKAALYEAAMLEDDVLGRPEQAIAVYRKVIELDVEDLKSVDALVSLYLRLERWKELLEIQTQKADLVLDVGEKKNIFYEMGAVYERELTDVPRAIAVYQKVLELDPDDTVALGRLDSLYQAEGSWVELLAVLAHEADLAADSAESIGFHYRIAEIYEKQLGDTNRAVELYRDILNQQPDHAPTLQALEGLMGTSEEALNAAAVLEPVYEAIGEHQKLIRVVEVQAKHTADVFARTELLHRIARLQEDSLGDVAAAFETYGRAVAVDHQNEETLGALERLAMAQGRWRDVAALYDAQLDGLESEPEQYVELASRVAQIYDVQLENYEQAIQRYRGVLRVEPENQGAVRSLDRLFTGLERWEDLASILAKEAELGESPDEILNFRFRLGQVFHTKLNDIDRAVSAYADVLNAAPEHAEAQQALETLFEAGVKQLEIGEILEPLYQATSDFEKLIEVHKAQLSQLTAPEERLLMYYRIAEEVEEHLFAPDQAFAVYVAALGEFPLDERVGQELERLAEQLQEGWEVLANTYADRMAQEGASAEVQANIGRRLAAVFEHRLADVDKAVEAYRYALTVSPGDPQALEELDRIFATMEQYEELAGVLEQRAALCEDTDEKAELLTRLGRVYEEHLGRVPDAIRAYRTIFDEAGPDNEDATQALVGLYTQSEAWTELEYVFNKQLASAMGDVQEANIRAQLAHLLFERLDRVDQAVEGWKRVLDLRGEDPEALNALGDIYEKQQRWSDLSDVLERHYDIADTDEERVRALSRRARISTHPLGRDDDALATWERVLEIDYGNAPALLAIADIWRRREDNQELVQALHSVVDRAASALSPEVLVAAYREMGTLYGTVLDQQFEASQAWAALLAVDPRDFQALDELEKCHRADQNLTDVVDVKMRRAAALEEPAEKVRELLEVCDIWRKEIGEYDGATAAYEEILKVDASHQRAFEELEKLHTHAERWEPLVELYLARLDVSEQTAMRSDLLRRIARVFDEKLNDKGQAFDALLTAFEGDYGDEETARYLEKVTEITKRWSELLAQANEWLKDQSLGTKDKIRLCLRLGKWYGENLQRPDYAEPYYAQVTQMDPDNAEVLRLRAGIFRMRADWRSTGATLQAALKVARSAEDRSAILYDLGELFERHMNQPDQGIAHYRQSLDLDPRAMPALEALERIYTARSEHTELVTILETKIQGLTDPNEIATVKRRLGTLYEEDLHDLEAAGKAYASAAALREGDLQALRGLERVYETLHKWTDLVSVLERQLEAIESARERVAALCKLARLQETEFLKPDIAAERFEQALDLDPTLLDAYQGLERCYARLKQWRDLVGAYERHIAELTESADRVALYADMAKIYSNQLDEPEQAIGAYQNIVDVDPNNVAALDALAALFDKQGEAARAIDAMRQVADLTTDGTQRVDMYYRIGRALEQKLQDRAEARFSFEQALDLDPAHLPSIRALRAIAQDDSDWDTAAEYMEQEYAHTDNERARAKVMVELGRLRQEKLGLYEEAMAAFATAVKHDSENEEAALPLVQDYANKGSWAEARPLAETLVRRSRNREKSEQHLLNALLGKILAALGDDQGALTAFQNAHQLDATDLEAVRGIASASYRLADWPSALTNYQRVLTSLGEDDVEQRTEVYFRLGCIKKEQGQVRQAISHFEKALALDGEHRPTLEALVATYESAGDWKDAAEYRRQILDGVYDEEHRYQLLLELGNAWAGKAKDPRRAIEAFEEARDIRPGDHSTLHRLMNLYQEVGDWQNVVDTIRMIADMEQDTGKKARYFFAMGQLYRDKLDDADRAIELFNESLDLDPDNFDGFTRIEKILTSQKNWKQLERSYRKMLHRIAGKNKETIEYQLWHALGLIYRDRMQTPEPAMDAFKMASKANPELMSERRILAELYEAHERFDEAIVEERYILKSDPLRAEPYRNLYRLFLHKRSYDEAWCAAGALTFMQKAGSEEKEFYEGYKPTELYQVSNRVTDELWMRCLFHEDENLYLSKIFEMIAPAALKAKIEQLNAQRKGVVVDKRFKQDPVTSTITFAKTFGWTAQVIGVVMPELYVRNDKATWIEALATQPMASEAGQHVLSGYTPQELAFVCARHLAGYRGEHYIRNLFPTQSELTIMLFAGIMIAAPNTPMPKESAASIRQTATALRKWMEPAQLENLQKVVKKFIAEGAKANVKKWNLAVDLTASRTGLVLCGDLNIAKKVLTQKPVGPGEASAADTLKDLMPFTVSKEYSTIRKALGIDIKVE